MRRFAAFAVSAAVALAAPAHAQDARDDAPPVPRPAAPRTESDPDCRRNWLRIVDEIQRWEDTVYPESALENGRPTCCPDRITDPSLGGIERRRAQQRIFLQDLKEIDPGCLAGQDLLGWQLLVREMELADAGHRFRAFLMPVSGRNGPQQDIPQMADRVPFRTEDDYANLVRRLSAVPQAVRDVQELMQLGVSEGRVPPRRPWSTSRRSSMPS